MVDTGGRTGAQSPMTSIDVDMEATMNTFTDLQQALAASRAADLRREACLARLARAARQTQTTRSGERVRALALAARQRLSRLMPASPTATPVACCA